MQMGGVPCFGRSLAVAAHPRPPRPKHAEPASDRMLSRWQCEAFRHREGAAKAWHPRAPQRYDMHAPQSPPRPGQHDHPLVRWGLTLLAIGLLTVLVIVPVVNVFVQALGDGPAVYWTNLIGNPDT